MGNSLPDMLSVMRPLVHFNTMCPNALPSPKGVAECSSRPFIRFESASKRYPEANGGDLALRDVSLSLPAGGLVAIVGKSGSGKSTLLNLLTAVDRPTAGVVEVAGVAVHQLDETKAALWRRASVGIVFQFFQLLPSLTVFENVLLPMILLGQLTGRERADRANRLLEQVGIAEQAHKLPTALSGGQQQRCAIARALANDPPLLVADEPTGNLDSQTADAVLQVLRGQADAGKTVVVVTHELDIARTADRIITLSDGRVASDERTATASKTRSFSS